MSVVTQRAVTKHRKYQPTSPLLLQWRQAGLQESYTCLFVMWSFFSTPKKEFKCSQLYVWISSNWEVQAVSLVARGEGRKQITGTSVTAVVIPWSSYFQINGFAALRDLWWDLLLLGLNHVCFPKNSYAEGNVVARAEAIKCTVERPEGARLMQLAFLSSWSLSLGQCVGALCSKSWTRKTSIKAWV